MKNVKLNIRKIGRQGFSLIEMLVVIAVIGVIAAIAIPNIGSINSSARNATAQRNAQTIASTVNAALAAGVTVDTLGADIDTVITNVGAGVTAVGGAFDGKTFIVPGLPASGSPEYTDMTAKLTYSNDANNASMTYTPNP